MWFQYYQLRKAERKQFEIKLNIFYGKQSETWNSGKTVIDNIL